MVEALKETIEKHLLTPQQLLDKYKDYLDFISNYYHRSLEKDDAYNQAYMELLGIYREFPTITDKKLKNKVTHKLWSYVRKERRNRIKNIGFGVSLNDKKNIFKKDISNEVNDQIIQEYLRNNNRLIPVNILESIEEKQEKEIINMYFFYGYKEKEIAKYYNLSHQRINKIKSRALKKIKNFLL